MKESQGSVEVTSFGQMNSILHYGHYIVGDVQGKTVYSIHDVINLKLEKRDKQLSKTSYSLDELRDLESKLVLITGSKAESRAEVEQYVDVSENIDTRIVGSIMIYTTSHVFRPFTVCVT